MIVALIGVSVSIAGMAVFLRYSLGALLRLWLARLVLDRERARHRPHLTTGGICHGLRASIRPQFGQLKRTGRCLMPLMKLLRRRAAGAVCSTVGR